MTKIKSTYEELGETCRRCKTRQVRYSHEFDVKFCTCKDKWLEAKCNWRECFYCPNRPEKPSDIEWVKETEEILNG